MAEDELGALGENMTRTDTAVQIGEAIMVCQRIGYHAISLTVLIAVLEILSRVLRLVVNYPRSGSVLFGVICYGVAAIGWASTLPFAED